ncbi:hypothetical protein PVAND_016837 [Polypedilum vanderplanki]|uniref:Guanylate cyclase n=1 Tax=Polypedilum vanderplanki TaxID=319348 RepID=A0A9J6BGZ3_POLVA|nr:hypothetical protein PVAND_016837 [Polypedilum vanderplanki]
MKALTIVLVMLSLLTLCNGFEVCGNYKKTDKTIRIGFLSRYTTSKVILGAVPLAIEHINSNNKLLPGRVLEYQAVNIVKTSSVEIIKNMTNLMLNSIDAFIGPEDLCFNEALVASAWNIPLISYSCADMKVGNKTQFSTFARSSLGPPEKISKSVIALLSYYNWRKFIIDLSSKNNLNLTQIKEFSDYLSNKHENMEKIVDETFKKTRIYVFVGGQYAFVAFMHCLEERDLLNSGEYMVILVNDEFTFPNNDINQSDHHLYRFFSRSKKKTLNPKTFQSVLQITLTTPSSNLTQFHKEIRAKAHEKFNVPLHSRILPLFLSAKAAYLYDAVMIYAKAATQMLNSGGNIKDGTTLMQKFVFNNTFTSVQGFDWLQIGKSINNNPSSSLDLLKETLLEVKDYIDESENILILGDFNHELKWGSPLELFMLQSFGTRLFSPRELTTNARTVINGVFGRIEDYNVEVFIYESYASHHKPLVIRIFIDENGNAEGNFSLFTISYINKTYSVQQVGTFVESNSQNGIPKFQLNNKSQISWVNGNPPIDEPSECGFEGCSYNWSYAIMSCFTILGFMSFIGIIIKHYRYEQRLQSLLWKIDLKEITQLAVEDETYGYNKIMKEGNKELIIAKYRGNFVAMKRINKRAIELTRNVRKELQIMRELRHENLSQFIGVTLETSNIFIISQFYARGSLENLLTNDDLKLDEMFISSLVFDAIKGMIFLHDSEIGFHGNLRTSNCLVDSRWCLKIADFGLNEFQNGATNRYKLKNLLTKAPELFDPDAPIGTQKSDVYSFGILLYEIYGRKGPFGIGYEFNESTIPIYEDILAKLRNPQKHIRPSMNNFRAPDCVKETITLCWHKDPFERPDMKMIKLKLKELKWGLKSNIFDNIMLLMEKYASNLEELVQERTNQLVEEKKKTEGLLLRMLPKSVAETLICGHQLNAEYYDCVTIMFSDLVGFTEICSTSTPHEVVEMLNFLYSLMDSIITNFDCYKIETIGDAYMVCSGAPIRNEDHALQVASLALNIMEKVSTLEIPHKKGEFFKIRMGLHSGQVVAGIVGDKMPRYCLFGDSVNTASRMESTSEPLKIQISFDTFKLLKKYGNFVCIERDGGVTFIKGKGQMKTFWLMGKH